MQIKKNINLTHVLLFFKYFMVFVLFGSRIFFIVREVRNNSDNRIACVYQRRKQMLRLHVWM